MNYRTPRGIAPWAHPALRAIAASLLLAVALPAAHAAAVDHLNSSGALPPNLPFSAAVRAGNMYFPSGQLGVKPDTMALIEAGIEA